MNKKLSVSLCGLAAVAVILGLHWFSGRAPRPPANSPASVQTSQATHPVAQPAAGSGPADASGVRASTASPVYLPASSADTIAAATNAAPGTVEVFQAFHEWQSRFQQVTDAASRARLESEGETLALQRREAMARLIEADPQRALELAIPWAERQQLPAAITALLEQPVSGRGDLGVLGVLPDSGSQNQAPGIVRTAQIGDTTYRAFVYGRRMSQTSIANIPLHGVAIGNALALHESPLRVLDSAEAAARASEVAPASAKCPVSGNPVSVEDAAAVVDVGGQLRVICMGGHIHVLEGTLLAAEGTQAGDVVAASPNPWSQGTKSLLYIRVRFSDQTNDPQTTVDSQTMLTNVDSFFRENSYETTTIVPTITPVYTLSNDTAYYVTADIYQLRSDALAAAKADGYDYVNWNLDAVRYNGGPGAFSGAAYVGARGCWLKSSSAGVADHEFGHNYGLWHANSWNPSDESPIGPGTWQEYGDQWDTMGSAGGGIYHYNARYKWVLNWIPPEGYQTASNSGTYRVFAHDDITSSNSIRGLRIPRDSNKNYAIEFRQKWTGYTWMMNGAGLRRVDNSNNNNPGSELLDATPISPDSKNDSALLIGRTFSDTNYGVHITPIGKGGTAPESLDVVVNLGSFPGNSAPTLAIGASATSVSVGTAVTLTATADDANGDALAYSWDFADKTYGLNSASVTKTWNTTGEYVVRCIVSDMKGGTASRWIVITVGTPATYRISGRVTDAGGAPMQNVRVHNGLTSSSYRGCFTDVDGYYTIANLSSGSYTVGGAFLGYALNPSGFANPVAVSPSRTGINFIGTVKTYRITGRVTDGGLPVTDVLVSDGTRTALSNTNGDFVISNVPNGSYTVTASKSGYTFNASGWANPVVVDLADAINRNFVTPTYTITGEILGFGTTNFVTVTDGYRTTTSYKSGTGQSAKNLYSLSGVTAGSWNLRALFAGSSFSPSGFSNPLNVTGNATGKNFALDPVTTYSVSGTITYNGVPLAGANVTAGARSSVTDSRGAYFIPGLANGTYDVVPSQPGYGFTPASLSVTISGAGVSGQNFTASQVILPTVTLTASDADAAEPGSNTGRFTIARTGSTLAALTVFYSTAGTATAGADYTALPGSVVIPAGSSSVNITVTPLDDTQPECPETVVATLTADANYVIGSPNSATVTITDDDLPSVSVVAIDASGWENGGSNLTFRVTRTGCLSSALTVNYALGGSATAGTDYQGLTGSINIPANSASAVATLTPVDDQDVEGDETVTLTLSSSASYAIGSPASATITILDNEGNHAPQANAGLDQNVSVLGQASLNGSATDDGLPGGGLSFTWSKISGPGTVVAWTPDAQNTTACFSMIGNYVLRLTANDGQLSGSDDVNLTVTATDPAKVVNAVKAAGPQYTDTQGIVYRSDTWFTGGVAASSGATIAATADLALYQSERNGSFAYNIPVSGGSQNYLVVLKFAETSATAVGQRVFDVSVDGNLVLNNLDLYAMAGANTAVDLVLPITSSSSSLNIAFQPEAGSALDAKVNAILVGAAQVLSPAAPASLTATATSSSQIALSWADTSANETSFTLESSTNGTTFTTIATLGANVTSYTHSGLKASTTYYYRVRACDSAGCSSAASASAQTLAAAPAAPSGLTATAASGSQINLAWTDNSANESGFYIERSPTGSSFTVIGTNGPNVRTFASTGLSANTRYYYRVRAFNNLGNSAYSNTANTKTKSR